MCFIDVSKIARRVHITSGLNNFKRAEIDKVGIVRGRSSREYLAFGCLDNSRLLTFATERCAPSLAYITCSRVDASALFQSKNEHFRGLV